MSKIGKIGSYYKNRLKFLHGTANQGHYGHCVRIAKYLVACLRMYDPHSGQKNRLKQPFGNPKTSSRMQKWRATRRLLLNSYSSKSLFHHPRSNPISDHSTTISRSSSGTIYIYHSFAFHN